MSNPSGFKESAEEVAKAMATGPIIRAVNFHNTPRPRGAQYEKQIEGLSRSFSSVNENELDAYLATGQWSKAKPGVIIAVYEGYRNGYDVLLPLLDRYQLIGWFFVITGFVKAAPAEQFSFASSHEIDMQTREYADGRYAMSWDELRQIDRRHVVACHTRSHISLAPLDPQARENEILGAQRDFKENLGHAVRSFASFGGPPYGKNPESDRLMDRAGYQFLFSNLKIQRLRKWASKVP
jgi:peptidoglycan/xylan/chitin deacetylase (PgdA/CDA1 family)